MGSHYIDEFLEVKNVFDMLSDMLSWNLFSNDKEITKSFGAYAAVRKHLWDRFSPQDPTVKLVAVGDGLTPSTAVTFALRTKWHCYSVDPRLSGTADWKDPFRRLTVVPTRVEEFQLEAERVIIVAVHSHANLAAARGQITSSDCVVVAIPCCEPQTLQVPPTIVYNDQGIWSPKRTVCIWK